MMTTFTDNLVIKMLENLPKGHAKIMYGRIVWRVGDKYMVGETINHRSGEWLTIEQASDELHQPVAAY